MPHETLQKFNLGGRVAIITGGAGFLGVKHAEAVLDAGGIPVLLDLQALKVQEVAERLEKEYGAKVIGLHVDIASKNSLEEARELILQETGRIDILINNAANNPKVETGTQNWSRLESFPLETWEQDLAVSLTGSFLASQIFGAWMANHGGGVILNIASDLGVIAPDQRIYRKEGLPENDQPVKPITYSVAKHGLIGLTKYLATYWADKHVRVNSLSPGGVYANQPEDFVMKLTNLIPMGRMANRDEYKAAILFLISDASSYMTGANLIMDGGKSVW